MKQSTKRLLSAFLCAMALTSAVFVGGCGSTAEEGKDGVSIEQVSNAQISNFNDLIEVKNRFNKFTSMPFAKWNAETNEGLKTGQYEESFHSPDYAHFQENLKRVKDAGSTYKAADEAIDGVLTALDELVPVWTDLKGYFDSKGYMADNYGKAKELAPKYLAAVDKFNTAMDILDATIAQINKENSQKDIEKYKSSGKKNRAAAVEATYRFTEILDGIEANPQSIDQAKIEQNIGEVSPILNSINSNEGNDLKTRGNALIGAIRTFVADQNENNARNMYDAYNRYIDEYNDLDGEALDKK